MQDASTRFVPISPGDVAVLHCSKEDVCGRRAQYDMDRFLLHKTKVTDEALSIPLIYLIVMVHVIQYPAMICRLLTS